MTLWCCSLPPYVWHDLEVVAGLSSVAALRLYETVLVLHNRQHRKVTLNEMELSDRLDVAGTYRSAADFRSKVVGAALKQVNAIVPFQTKIDVKDVHFIVSGNSPSR